MVRTFQFVLFFSFENNLFQIIFVLFNLQLIVDYYLVENMLLFYYNVAMALFELFYILLIKFYRRSKLIERELLLTSLILD